MVLQQHYTLTVDKKNFEVKAVKTSHDYKELRTEVNTQSKYFEIVELSMTEKDEVKDNFGKKIEEKAMHLSKSRNGAEAASDSLYLLASYKLTSLTCTQSWILVLHQSAAPHIIIHLVQAFLLLQMMQLRTTTAQ